MSLRRLTGLDTAFLSAERPGNFLHVMGLLILDPGSIPGGYRFERFREFLAGRLPSLPPLRRRLVEVPGGLARPYWVDDSDVDLDAHVRRAAVPSPGGPREVAEMAAEMMERPLDRSRPLWEMRLVEGLEGGRVALLAKLSHAMMDGMAGVKLMASIFNTSPEILPAPQVEETPPGHVPGDLELLARTVPWLLRQPRRAVTAAALSVRNTFGRMLRSEEEAGAEISVPRSWLNTPISPYRSIAYGTLPLADLHAVGRAHGATVNDVILAVAGGALRSYLEPRGLLPTESLVAGVPLAVRREGDERANAMTSVSVSLATDEEDPVARLVAIREAMAVQKRRRHRTMGGDLAAWADVPPPVIFSWLSRAYVDLDLEARMTPIVNLIVSSVPGPPEDLYLAGARLVGIHPLGPIFSGMALNVTAIVRGGSVDVGLVACRRRIPDLWELEEALPAALRELLTSAVEAADAG